MLVLVSAKEFWEKAAGLVSFPKYVVHYSNEKGDFTMTHRIQSTMIGGAIELLGKHGFDGRAQTMERLLKECMKIERREFLGVGRISGNSNAMGRPTASSPNM